VDIGELKQQLREQRDGMEQDHAIRLHRALSWLECADKYSDDDDVAFLSLWIGFNACYDVALQNECLSERESFKAFVAKLSALDEENHIYDLLWLNYSNFVRAVVENKFLFEPFWRAYREGVLTWVKRRPLRPWRIAM